MAGNATFALEDAMRLGAEHLENLVDERGRTYFNVFLTEPAEAVFDRPDFVDLPARYWTTEPSAGTAWASDRGNTHHEREESQSRARRGLLPAA